MPNVREVEFADHAAVSALVRAEGMGEPSLEKWNHLWVANPGAGRDETRLSRGWVLTEGSDVVGYVCNVGQEFRLGDRTLRSASAGSFVVRPDFRGQSLQLTLQFVRQAGVDLLLNTTCSPQASQIFQFLKFRKIPQADYDRSYYWVLRPARFLNAALRKKGYAKALSRLAGTGLGPLLWAETRIRGRTPPLAPGPRSTRTVEIEAIGDDFDDLWRRKLGEGRKLLACRDALTLRWHFAPRGRANPPFLVAAYTGTTLSGFAAVVLQDLPQYQLRRAYVADLFVEREDPATYRHLLAAVARHARARGAAMLEAVGFPEHVRRILRESRPRELVDPAWPYLYRAADAGLHAELGSSALWHACLYDGDGSL